MADFGDKFNWNKWLITIEPLSNIINLRRFKDKLDWSIVSQRINIELNDNLIAEFAEKWDKKYPMISDSWSRHWQKIIPFLQYPEFIKRVIYTTNIIEASNSQVRKVIKTKRSFPNDDAVYKIVYLALQNAKKKWTMPIKDWALALNQFFILFPERCKI